MKKNILILLLIISTSSKSHKLLTDIIAESEDFIGFGFASNSLDNPDDHSTYNLTESEIKSILLKINMQEAVKQFTVFSHRPIEQDYNTQEQNHEYSVITNKIPHSNQYWSHPYQYSCEEGVENCLDIDKHGGHHGGGVFNPLVSNVRLVAQRVCSLHPIDYGHLLVPYFLGPVTFSHLESLIYYPYVNIPVISDSHHIPDVYKFDQQILFKCAYKL